MSKGKRTGIVLLIISFALSGLLTACSSEETEQMEIRVNGSILFDSGDDFIGDVDGDFTGNGGSAERTFFWKNSLRTAEYNADITSNSRGRFEMTIKDADGSIILNKFLRGDRGADSFSGVTTSGNPGLWSVTINLTTFKGDGSFSISEGD